jgi:NAD(P)-dependent dehydrogenase (short-subunit alcohol dehydrogenase family)
MNLPPASASAPAASAADRAETAPPAPVVLVTGAAQRIGRLIALELASAGWAVAVHYRRSDAAAAQVVAEIRAAGGRAQSFCADLSVESECLALVPAICTGLGRIDAVVNNASLFEYDNAASFSYAAMERHWRANTAAPIVLAQALHAQVCGRVRDDAAARTARSSAVSSTVRSTVSSAVSQTVSHTVSPAVVNLLDQKLWNPNPDHLSYTLSKAALEAATTMLAQALAPHVRVCGVAPGLTLGSEMIDAAELERLSSTVLLGRRVDAGDIARSVRFVLDNRSMTGHTLLVDAGAHLTRAPRDFAFQSAAPASR